MASLGLTFRTICYEHPLPLVPRSGRKGRICPPSPSIGDAALKLVSKKNRPTGELLKLVGRSFANR